MHLGTRLSLFVLVALSSACASPVGISIGSEREVHRYLTQSALSSNTPSAVTQIELRRHGLQDAFSDDPDAALAKLHGEAVAEDLPADSLFALAELSFVRAESSKDRGRYVAALIYAYAYLFPETPRAALDPLDPRARTAADLYNRALSSAFRRTEDGRVEMREAAEIDIPFGHVSARRGEMPALGGYELYDFQPVSELEVRGFRNRYRRAGIGAPLAAKLRATAASEAQPVPVPPNVRVPLTAVLRFDTPLAQIRSGSISARLDLYSTLEVDDIDIGGRRVTLEAEPTAALAAGLTESKFWETELQVFLGNALGVRTEGGLGAVRPYKQGRIPAVFVHGTASSPARWADMVNDLLADDRLRSRYAFWFFTYDSGSPIGYSAWRLRDALTQAVERANPGGGDPCLGDMVVLGHSQGGLLTKMTAIDAGDRFWRGISNKPFDEVPLDADDKALLRNVLFVKPLPFVRRVMFLATPHRGSYLAGPQLVRRLANRLVRLPSDVARVGAGVMTLGATTSGAVSLERMPTSIDNMSPGNRFIRVLSEIPVAPGVTAHSIVAVDGDGPLEEAGDGVVKYQSTHVDGVASELIVKSPHSGMQAEAATIEEVRRLFLEHAAASACQAPGAAR